MKTPPMSSRVLYLLALLCFVYVSWRQYGPIVPVAEVAGGVVLALIVRRNARKRKVRDDSRQ